MKKLMVIVSLLLAIPGLTRAETSGTVVWLDGIGAPNVTKWQAAGFEVIRPQCDLSDAGCVVQTVSGLDDGKPVYLVARDPSSSMIVDLYAEKAIRDQLDGIFLLRVQVSDQPVATNLAPLEDAPNNNFRIAGLVFVIFTLFTAFAVWKYRNDRDRKAASESENAKANIWLTGFALIGVAGMLATGVIAWSDYMSAREDASVAEASGQQQGRSNQFSNPDMPKYTDAPELVILVEQSDSVSSIVATRKFTAAMRDVGIDATFLFANDGMLRGTSLHQMTFDILMHLTGNSPFVEQFAELVDLERQWQTPLFDNNDFYTKPEFIETKETPPIFKELIEAHYQFELHRAKQLEISSYQTFDLLAYRDEVAPGAQYVTFRNRRGQIYYLDLETYGAYEPVIVTGIDDVTNLFRLVWFYRTKAMYSWKPEVQNISVRPLGPVLFFEKEADIPADQVIPLLVRSALTLNGIEFWTENPLALINAYPPEVQRTITAENKCVYCHEIESLGARHHHIDAKTGEPQGGFGLPLVEYPDEAIQAFLYDQEKTAKKIGMTPNPLGEDVVHVFDDWLAALPRPASMEEGVSENN